MTEDFPTAEEFLKGIKFPRGLTLDEGTVYKLSEHSKEGQVVYIKEDVFKKGAPKEYDISFREFAAAGMPNRIKLKTTLEVL